MFIEPVKKLTVVLVAFMLFAGCASGDCDESADDAKSVEGILRDTVAKYDVPGMGAVVASSDGILELQVVGVKRLNDKVPLEFADPFHIGSVAKTFTATVIAKLVEANLLQWDTPVADVLPEVMEFAHSAYKGVTLSHLLSHEAGMQPMEEDAELGRVPELVGDIRSQRRQFAEWVLRQEPTVTPFAEYRYSNAHFVVAASMAEEVTDRSWEELVEEYIFAALNMRNAGFGWAGKHRENVPWGHMVRDGSLDPVDPNGDYQLPRFFAPAGDIHASLPDMASYIQAYLASWAEKGDFLKKDTLRHVWTRRLKSGLGWGVTNAFSHELVAMYTGSADTFFMVVIVIPEADVGVAIAANAYSEKVERAVIEALRGIVELHAPKIETTRAADLATD